ncbi:MAG: hypothetical protein ABSE07_03720 [Methanoregula sp.]
MTDSDVSRECWETGWFLMSKTKPEHGDTWVRISSTVIINGQDSGIPDDYKQAICDYFVIPSLNAPRFFPFLGTTTNGDCG